MNWLKAITKSGRQNLARELLKEHLTPKKIAEWAARGTNSLLAKIDDKEKLNRVACSVNAAADLAADLAAAVRDGHVDAEESASIAARAATLAGDLAKKDALDALIEKAVSYVP